MGQTERKHEVKFVSYHYYKVLFYLNSTSLLAGLMLISWDLDISGVCAGQVQSFRIKGDQLTRATSYHAA